MAHLPALAVTGSELGDSHTAHVAVGKYWCYTNGSYSEAEMAGRKGSSVTAGTSADSRREPRWLSTQHCIVSLPLPPSCVGSHSFRGQMGTSCPGLDLSPRCYLSGSCRAPWPLAEQGTALGTVLRGHWDCRAEGSGDCMSPLPQTDKGRGPVDTGDRQTDEALLDPGSAPSSSWLRAPHDPTAFSHSTGWSGGTLTVHRS